MARLLTLLVTAAVLAPHAALAAEDARVPVVFLEPIYPAPRLSPEHSLPLYRRLAPDGEVHGQATRWIANEAADFIRRILARAATAIPQEPDPRRLDDALFIALEPGGNHAALGFALDDPREGRTPHARTPFVKLSNRPDRLSKTLIHEGGHVAQRLALRTRPDPADAWVPFPHTTFAVTDRRTALSEGYASHYETLWGHFGQDPDARAYYDHAAPTFGPATGLNAEAWFPLRDLLSYSQGWARYQGVREGLPAFRGHVVPGNYLRSQVSPMRDLASLKNAGQMLASEGVVASFCFRFVAQRAEALGARPHAGLEQAGVVQAEVELLQALRVAHDRLGTDASVLDVVGGIEDVPARERAIAIWLDLTRGVTADAAMADRWRAVYAASEAMDLERVQGLAKELEALRTAQLNAAIADPGVLARAVGPVLPVRAGRKSLRLKALGEPFPLEFDLNAAGEAEWAALPGVPPRIRAHILAQAAKGPFAGFEDFRRRTGIELKKLGLAPVRRSKPPVIL